MSRKLSSCPVDGRPPEPGRVEPPGRVVPPGRPPPPAKSGRFIPPLGRPVLGRLLGVGRVPSEGRLPWGRFMFPGFGRLPPPPGREPPPPIFPPPIFPLGRPPPPPPGMGRDTFGRDEGMLIEGVRPALGRAPPPPPPMDGRPPPPPPPMCIPPPPPRPPPPPPPPRPPRAQSSPEHHIATANIDRANNVYFFIWAPLIGHPEGRVGIQFSSAASRTIKTSSTFGCSSPSATRLIDCHV